MDETRNLRGLRWIRTLWGLTPRWDSKLDKTAIKETARATLNLPDSCDVSFLAKGAFNKLYTVTSAEQQVVVRVTLPIDPKWKTLSEVATLQWVAQNTSLPVPRVLAYNIDRSNAVGFEWIIMNKIPGEPYMAQTPVQRQGKYYTPSCPVLFGDLQTQMTGIGSLFAADSSHDSSGIEGYADGENRVFKLSRMVSTSFINRGPRPNVNRGPFASSREWLSSRLYFAEMDCRHRLGLLQSGPANQNDQPGSPGDDGYNDPITSKDEDDEEDEYQDEDENEEDDPEDLENTLTIITKLRAQLDNFFPTAQPEPEASMLFHDDLNRHNILINEADGTLSAVVDWECISALPLSIACQYPSLLQGKSLDVEPIKSQYQDKDGQVADLYWEHLEDYELTRLRGTFIEEMRRLEPGWVQVFESSERQRDFVLAVEAADDPFMIRRILSWLGDVESGANDVRGLEERIDSGTL